MKASILIVDDEKDTRELMARALGVDYHVTTAPDAELAIKALEADPSIALMLSDVRMPGADGIQLLKAAKKMRPQLACILLTAFGSVDLAVEAMKDGADDFLTKPVDLDQLDLRVAKALKTRALEEEVVSLRSELGVQHGLADITGTSEAMQKVFRLIQQAAPTQATVLIEGPSGTGKELVAHALHSLSPRAKGPFVAVECAALNGNLLESELFGHEKGAFTDAVAKRIGRFEAARIVAACNRDLAQLVREGKFREDLYYRLAVIDIRLPALRERRSDIPLLVMRFLTEFAAANGNRVTGIAPAAMKMLEAYDWPGNVRELRNAVERMVVLSSGGQLDVGDVPDNVRTPAAAAPAALPAGTLEDMEKAKILAVLQQVGGNHSRAAQVLGISRRTLYRKLDKYEKEGPRT